MRMLYEQHINDIMYENPGEPRPSRPPLPTPMTTPSVLYYFVRDQNNHNAAEGVFLLFHQLIDNLLVISSKGVGRKIYR